MRFLVDQNLPTNLCAWLEDRGHTAEHVRLLGMRDANDQEIIHRARQTAAILLTRDKDFVPYAGGDTLGDWFQVVWVRSGNASNELLLEAFEQAWPDVSASLERGDPLAEIG
jgi:predicted nuclease of predicted toxin-antitoxin system